jgi:hypothetical protein
MVQELRFASQHDDADPPKRSNEAFARVQIDGRCQAIGER